MSIKEFPLFVVSLALFYCFYVQLIRICRIISGAFNVSNKQYPVSEFALNVSDFIGSLLSSQIYARSPEVHFTVFCINHADIEDRLYFFSVHFVLLLFFFLSFHSCLERLFGNFSHNCN